MNNAYGDDSLTDSLPIILCQRAYQAKVALQAVDKGDCSTTYIIMA
jgi:hypothetical protein